MDITFPVTLTHPLVEGTTTSATPTSLRVLEKRGWVREKPPVSPKTRKAHTTDPEPTTDTSGDTDS